MNLMQSEKPLNVSKLVQDPKWYSVPGSLTPPALSPLTIAESSSHAAAISRPGGVVGGALDAGDDIGDLGVGGGGPGDLNHPVGPAALVLGPRPLPLDHPQQELHRHQIPLHQLHIRQQPPTGAPPPVRQQQQPYLVAAVGGGGGNIQQQQQPPQHNPRRHLQIHRYQQQIQQEQEHEQQLIQQQQQHVDEPAQHRRQNWRRDLRRDVDRAGSGGGRRARRGQGGDGGR